MMKNPFRHHAHGDTTQHRENAHGTPAEDWQHMQQDVDPDCVRDPGSDLIASWNLEHSAAEEALEAGGKSADGKSADENERERR
jgi:hypothetical protein